MANRKWTQQKLAKEAGLSVEILGRILRGDMAATLRHFAHLEVALETHVFEEIPIRKESDQNDSETEKQTAQASHPAKGSRAREWR